MKKYHQFKKLILKDKQVNAHYNALEPEFLLIQSIIKKRLEQGWSQQDLANKIGTKQPVISRLERGTYNPSLKFMNRVAKAFKAKLVVEIK
jgi:ribosome-binding protein aMBF1 (putative translation factor)